MHNCEKGSVESTTQGQLYPCAPVCPVCVPAPPGDFLPAERNTVTVRLLASQVKSSLYINNTYECAPEASSGGREWAEMTEGFHLEATRHRC